MLFKQHHHLLQQTVFECINTVLLAIDLIRDGSMGHGFGCGDRRCIDWHQRYVVVLSALCPLAVYLVYRAFVAAVAATVSVLAWAVCFKLLVFRFCVGRTPRAGSLWCPRGGEYTPSWVGTLGLHGTEWQTLDVTLHLSVMRRYYLREGDLVSTSPPSF